MVSPSPRANRNTPPTLHHDPRDWRLAWQWRAPEPTRDHLHAARPQDATSTYLAGFATREAAVRYGERNGWVAE